MNTPASKNRWITAREGGALLALVALIALISIPVLAHRIFDPVDNDYGSHIAFAMQMLKHQQVPAYIWAHPVFQILIGGIYWASRAKIGLWHATLAVLTTAQIAQAVVLFFWLGPGKGHLEAWKRAVLIIIVIFAAPMIALVPLDGRYYFGYIGLANYHNPTVLLLRPLAILSFIFGVGIFEQKKAPLWAVVLSAFILIASALVKPNYTLSVLPVLGLMAIVCFLRKQPVDWRMAIFGFAAPGVLVLVGQALLTYWLPGAEKSSILFSPLTVESGYSGYLFWKLLLSCLFPLTVLLVFNRSLRGEVTLLAAWLGFAAGAAQMYLLAESNNRFYDANFRWSAQIMLFLLLAASVRTVWQRETQGGLTLRQRLPIYLALLLQLAAGALYYFHVMTVVSYG